MSLGLQLLNLFVAMCKGVSGVPRDLFLLGYRLKYLEIRFQNAQGQAVVPELVLSSPQTHHTVLFEWKSGPNLDEAQLQRYNHVTHQDLVQRCLIPPAECTTHDITIIGVQQHRDRLLIGFDQGGLQFPLLIKTDDGLEIARNRFTPDEVDNIFRPVLRINWATVPMGFFVIDPESTLSEVAEHVIPSVLEQMSSGAARILAGDIAKKLVPLWDLANQNFKDQVVAKITTVITSASENEFRDYLRRNRRLDGRTHTPTWEVLDNPLFENSDRRMKGWKTMRRLQKELLLRLAGQPIQPMLPMD